MRIRTCVLAALVLASTPRVSVTQPGRFGVGALVAPNFGWISTEIDDNTDRKRLFGGQTGIFLSLRVAPFLSIEPEFLVISKGDKIVADTSDDFSGTLRVVALELPILAKFTLVPLKSSVRPFLTVGPAFGVNVYCYEKISFGSLSSNDPCSDEDDLNYVDVSGVIGGGVEFGRIAVFMRYEHGFVNVFANDDDDGGSKLRTLSTGIRLRFNR